MDLARLGLFILLLGVAGILRLIPEVIAYYFLGRVYHAIMVSDLLFGIAMVAAGQGLRTEKLWAPSLALQTAGAVLSTSLGWGILFGFSMLDSYRSLRSELAMLPRMLFYGIAVMFWPYGVAVLMRTTSRESRIYHWVSFATWAATGVFFVTGLHLWGRLFTDRFPD